MHTAGELTRVQLADGVYLHLHSIGLYKTIRVDVCLSTPLCAPRHSLVALSSQLLARGTHKLPNIQSLNRFIDDLYGAHYSVQADRLGEHQFIHLSLEIIDDNFLGEKGILVRGLSFLRDVLCDGSGFQCEYLEREKHRLARQIADGFNDSNGCRVCCDVTRARRTVIPDGSKKLCDVVGILVGVEYGKDVNTSVGCDFHTWKQVQRTKLRVRLLFQLKKR